MDGNYVNGDLPMHELTPDEIERINEAHERRSEELERWRAAQQQRQQ